ncbi:GAF domain nucleotide-binding protein [Zopfochytrium polystomum]|nr:GAF domain nucleotide-binding protein [Zopfochytrium polystomum]
MSPPTVPAAGTLSATSKPAFYAALTPSVRALLDPSLPQTANLANVSSALFYALRDPPVSRPINWLGFYLTAPLPASTSNTAAPAQQQQQQLVLGPFQGRVACTTIRFGRGVCGTAAARRETVVVEDVEKFPGHIACDSESRSEIVVPIVGRGGEVFGVLDVDCLVVGGFDEEDRVGMEAIVKIVVEVLGL